MEIVVGGMGIAGTANGGFTYGGGGGSFVLANTGPNGAYVPILAAGGGAYRSSPGGSGVAGNAAKGAGRNRTK